jgi:hypothetical protein
VGGDDLDGMALARQESRTLAELCDLPLLKLLSGELYQVRVPTVSVHLCNIFIEGRSTHGNC